jgi:acyl phosphate:glycerol-3-phosphate acyltransferase
MPDPISWAHSWPYYLAFLAIGYALGSIPFGFVLTRLAGLGDIRKIGSGNIGATNVLRTGRKGLAALTLLLDGAKGSAAVLIGASFGPDMTITAGFGAILGHLWPVWLRFMGGKGVATGLGILLALAPPVGGLTCLTWLVAAWLTRYSSGAALAAFGLAPLYAWWLTDPQRFEFALVLAFLVGLRHYENIGRLFAGTEPKIGKGGGAPS